MLDFFFFGNGYIFYKILINNTFYICVYEEKLYIQN